MEATAPARLDRYVPRVVLRRLAADPSTSAIVVDGTVVFVDLSGFTKLSERLARRGDEGAELLVDAIDRTFSQLLVEAYDNGASLLKFGGDALLLLFEGPGHELRGCRSAACMRRTLTRMGMVESGGVRIRLRMSAGVHSDRFHLFLAGDPYRELLTTGPAWTTVVRMEAAAEAGDILLSPSTAAALPSSLLGPALGPGRLLAGLPEAPEAPDDPPPGVDPALVAACVPTAVLAYAADGEQPPEHRVATVAFVHYAGTDALIAQEGPEAAARELGALVDDVAAAADELRVSLLGTDVDADGGKFMLCAGAPTATDDVEERMLLALRRVVEGHRRIPVRAGANRGAVFAGDVGPTARRTYTTMGDATNLAARLMSRAQPGQVLVTGALLEHSATAFETTRLEPFTVKGKSRPVQAWALGPALGRRARAAAEAAVTERFPLVGRDREIAVLEAALADARAGRGRLVELVGEPGLGKTRLLEELEARAGGLEVVRGVCETYTAAAPHRAWREPLQELLGLPRDAGPAELEAAVRARVRAHAPELEPWLPLLAVPLGLVLPDTPEVARLAPEFRTARLHGALLDLLARAVPRPVLLEFGDVHLMDRASADLLAALAGRLEDVPWLVAVTRRDVDEGFVAGEGPAILTVEPAPLAPADALRLAELATEDAPLPPGTVALAAQRSAGNPQFLRDLLRAAGDGVQELPRSIEAAAVARIDRLGVEDRALVRRAAVLGVSFDTALLEHVLEPGAPRPDALTWARLNRYFADEGGGRRHFRRAVVREVAYAGLPFRVRRRLHAEVGAVLEARLGAAPADQAAVLSLHFAAAGDAQRAWRYARLAGDRAAAEFAHADAAVLYGRALEAARRLRVAPAERADVWQALGEARARTGELGAAMAAFTAARRAVRGDRLREAALLHRHALTDLDAGRVRQAVRWCLRGARVLEGEASAAAHAQRAELTATLATIRLRAGRVDDAVALCRTAIADAEAAGASADRALARACHVLDWALAESGRPSDGRHSRRALAIYECLCDLDRQAAVLNNMGGMAYWAGDWTAAVALYRRAAAASAGAGDTANAAFGDCNVGEVLSDQGRVDEAEALLHRARRVWRGTGYEWGVGYTTALLGRAAARRGDAATARTRLDDAVSRFSALGTAGDAAWADSLRAEAAACAGDAADALRRADRLLLDQAGTGRLAPLLHRVRGFALAQLGEFAAAEGALGASLAESRLQDEPFEIARALQALNALDVRCGRPADPARAEECERLLERLGVVSLPPAPLGDAGPADGAGLAEAGAA